MSQSGKTLFIGFVAGFLVGLVVLGILRPSGDHGDKVVAKLDGTVLKQKELRHQVANQLIPIENDEYQIFLVGLSDWVNSRLFEKEARSRGVASNETDKEIWSRVHVTYDDIWQAYNKDRAVYGNSTFEQASSAIAAQIRTAKFSQVREVYLQELRKKYHVEILMQPPKSYVPGLALSRPSVIRADDKTPEPPSLPAAVQPTALAMPPQPGAAGLMVGKPGVFPSMGPDNAPVKMVEFADFQCHFCKQIAATLEQVLKNYPDKVQLVFRHYPLSPTPGTGSFLIHEASMCAHEQGKFWQFYDEVYRSNVSGDLTALQALAGKIGADTNKFKGCLESHKYQNAVQEDLNLGKQKGIQGTPTVFVNDQTVNGAYPYDYFVQVIQSILNPGKVAPPTQPAAAAPQPAAPAAVINFDDLEGRPSEGPEKAPVTLVEFSDFQCPFCKKVTPAVEQLMKAYQGKIRRVWRQYPLPFHAGSAHTAEASECANDQGKFWSYHDKLFETQGGPRDDAALIHLAKDAGLNKKKFEKCLSKGKYKDLVQKEIAKGNQAGVNGTPAFFINGRLLSGAQPYESFQAAVEAALNPGKFPSPVVAPQPPPAPVGPVKFDDLQGRPSEGPENAPITLVEFSDFHCPFCKRVTPAVEQLMKAYPGKIRRVWRHYPLPMHAGSSHTHEASECAHEQGKFWEYHDKLFETQGSARDDASLVSLAQQIGIDTKKFQECLSGGKYKDLIQKEVAKGNQYGVRGTPNFFINGQVLPGAVPYESFDSLVKSELQKKS